MDFKGKDMSVTRVKTVAFNGMEALDIDVEVQITSGLPKFVIVGLPDTIVSESKTRISAALIASLPPKSITVNLSPAHIRKEGSHYDLPIALALLAALNIIPAHSLERYIILGELSLDGRILPVNGVLLASMHANAIDHNIICPAECGSDAVLAGGSVKVLAPENLLELVNYFKNEGSVNQPELELFGKQKNAEKNSEEEEFNSESFGLDFNQIKGQESAKRAMLIAASGGHHILMIGPPGSGKSMLAMRLPTILPQLDPETALDTTIIYNLVGKSVSSDSKTADNKHKLIRKPPFRDPHHSASLVALVGGGTQALPGEISLANGGILFLDELPEFSRHALESLRQPMESGKVTLSRAQAHATYPAHFQLIAAMNPCKCGMLGEKKCATGARCATSYWSRLSGPLLDRFDLCVNVQKLQPWEISSIENTGESSKQLKQKVILVRKLQLMRQNCLNVSLSNEKIESVLELSDDVRVFITEVAKKHNLSGRGYYRLLKVARTIADLRLVEQLLHESNDLDSNNEKLNLNQFDSKTLLKDNAILVSDIAEAVTFKLVTLDKYLG